MHARHRICGPGLLLIASVACTGHAAAGTFNVKSVEVRKDESELTLETAWQDGFPANSDFIRQSYKTEYSYGLSDRFKASIELNLEQRVGDNLEARSAGPWAQFVLLEPQLGPIGLAWFMRYDIGVKSGESDVLTFGPLVSFALAKALKVTLNPLFEKEWNPSKPGIKSSYAWQVKAEATDNIGLGVEGYGSIPNIGDPPGIDFQEHRIGPVLYIAFDLDGASDKVGGLRDMSPSETNIGRAKGRAPAPKMELQLGVLFGLTEATADIAGKTKLAFTF
jgi:hypothetical protein